MVIDGSLTQIIIIIGPWLTSIFAMIYSTVYIQYIYIYINILHILYIYVISIRTVDGFFETDKHHVRIRENPRDHQDAARGPSGCFNTATDWFFLSNGIMIPTVCLGEKHINHHNDYKSIYIYII